MSISPTNIKTRIELETRVLAAALKQSFERGDSDGVGLAHRQLFLLLKDQKPGNGSSSVAADIAPTGSNGDTSGYEEAIEETEEQPEYVAAAYAESEDPEYAQPLLTSAETADYQEDEEEQEQQQQVDAEEEEQAEEPDQVQYAEDEEIPQIQQETEVPYLDADEIEAPQDLNDPEQAHAIAQYLKYKQTRDQLSAEEAEQSDNISPPQGWHEIEAPTAERSPVDEVQASEPQQPLSEEEDYIRMRKVPPVAKVTLAFDQPSAEYAEIFGSSIIETEPPQVAPTSSTGAPFQPPTSISGASAGFQATMSGPAQDPDIQPGPFDALVEPPSYGQFISSAPPSSHEPLSVNPPIVEEQQSPANQASETEDEDAARSMDDHAEVSDAIETMERHEEWVEQQDSQSWETAESTQLQSVDSNIAVEAEHSLAEESLRETEYAETEAEHVVQSEAEYVEEDVVESASEHVEEDLVEPDSEQIAAPVETETTETIEPVEAASGADDIPPPPSFEGQFYSPQNLGVRSMSSGFAPPPESSDLPAELLQAPTTEFPKIQQNSTQELPMVGQSANQGLLGQSPTGDLPMLDEGPTQGLPMPGQNATQDMPQIMNDIRNQQAADYATRKASQSSPRNMPAIDFSLQSESTKPDIDFSLQSESKGPNIDFTTQPKSNKPDIDFSLQSESSKPDIDFSLQSESQNQATDDSLNAPTGGGFIEAEFVSSDADATAEYQQSQDVTSELPILNPAASLYLEPDETNETQTQKLAAAQMAAKQAEAQPTSSAPPTPVPPKTTVPFTGIPMMVIPNHAAPPAPPAVSQALGKSAAAETTGQEEPLPVVPKPPDLYAMLGVSQMSPFEEIHKNFLRKIRKILLKLRGAVRPERDELLKELRRNWVARDILCDPVTRTDYDFRDMGLRGSPDGAVPHVEDGPQRIGQRTPLRIGELLQCAGLLEQAELEIACDMHKAMPEVQFGTFLVRQGFIQERDLDSVLLGQTLLRDGKITVAQFQVAMELSQSRGANISDTLIEHGYITAAELAKLIQKASEPNDPQAGDTPTIKEVAVKPRQVEPAAPSNLNASSAVPTWKDQLDWSKPLPVDDDVSLMDRNPEKQSLAELLGNVNTDASVEPDKVKISNNAAPSWKDQLDWEQPSDSSAADATTGSAEGQPEVAEQTQPDESNPISLANAVPSWKDQLDWEQPKEASQPPQGSVTASKQEEQDDEDEYYDDEPLRHSSKETQPISIHPPTSVAPNVTLGKGRSGTTSSTNMEPTAEDQYMQEVLQTTDIFEQSIDTGGAAAAQSEESDAEHDDHDDHDEHDSDDDEHTTEEGEGFFKKTLGKLKKGDPKDKKKKRK